MVEQNCLLEDLSDIEFGLEILKQLPPILNLMIEQFPEDWSQEWIDRLYWLNEQVKGDVDLAIDEIAASLNRLQKGAASGQLQWTLVPVATGRSPGSHSRKTESESSPAAECPCQLTEED